MATPVIVLGALQALGRARQVARTVEVGETFQQGGKTEKNSLSKR
jgi:hypothetical protein